MPLPLTGDPSVTNIQRPWLVPLILFSIAFSSAAADVELEQVENALRKPIIESDLPWREVREFCATRVPATPEPDTVEEWERYASQTRERAFENVVFRGEAAAWREQPTEVEWLETIDGGPEYVIKKLRFQAVPGLWVPALLYEPKELEGRVPVVLNVNGHDGKGKVAPYKQIRCINQAKRGMLALNIEWLGMGQLQSEGFVHYCMNQLDLCGTSGLAPFYLSMSRGLDVLLQHEHADPERVAVAGLSGGGWQTIFISSLDTRVTLCDPVAGYSSFTTRAGVTSDLGDSEQTPCDLATVADYAQLTALRAPRPTLLTFNDRDNCCFAAGHALPPLLDAARPVYRLYGELDNLVAHVNHVPGSHNFDRDNREALYRMIGIHFYPDTEFDPVEIPCEHEIKSAGDLEVPLPEPNADFNVLARRLMESLPAASDDDADSRRSRLAEIVHTRHWTVEPGEVTAGDEIGGVPTTHWQLRIGEAWTVPMVEFSTPDPVTDTVAVVFAEAGRVAAAPQVQQRIQAGQRVIAIDPFYYGESKISQRDMLYGLLVSAVGERPLGIQCSQVIAISWWLRKSEHVPAAELIGVGPRASLIALTAAALETDAISAVELHQPFGSLKEVIEQNLRIPDGPEMFCFGLLKEFDLPQIQELVAPRPVVSVAQDQ